VGEDKHDKQMKFYRKLLLIVGLTVKIGQTILRGDCMNRAISTSIASVIVAQALKIPFDYLNTGKMSLKSAFTPGGMPSSHSSGVSSLATFIGLKNGFRSPEFAISCLLGLIVMYDAFGVRYHAGQTAMVVNELEESVERLREKHPEVSHHRKKRKDLKERLGHLPSEVVAGSLLGISLGAIGFLVSQKR